jgi:hypothetical protein
MLLHLLSHSTKEVVASEVVATQEDMEAMEEDMEDTDMEVIQEDLADKKILIK